MIMANNSWVLSFDNISAIPVWLSDALCRLSTGGGFSTRELYSNSEEMLFDSQRPTILNGIDDYVKREDLFSRCIVTRLERIDDRKRQGEKEMWERFEQIKPKILGSLFDLVSRAIRELPNTTLESLPRMADFVQWAVAAEGGQNQGQ